MKVSFKAKLEDASREYMNMNIKKLDFFRVCLPLLQHTGPVGRTGMEVMKSNVKEDMHFNY